MAIEKIKILGAEYSFYLKSIATYAPAFLGYNNSALARVNAVQQCTIFYATKSWVVRGLALYEITILLIIRSSIVRPKVNRDH